MNEHTPARPTVEGTVVPAGHTLGIPAEHADDVNARDAYTALVAAGHTPALLANDTDEDDNDTARGTGFVIDVREGGRVLVYQQVNGSTGRAVSDHKETLRAYRKTLRAAGWDCDGRIFKCVQAWRAPAEESTPPALPTLEGHTITATLKGSTWTVALHEDGNPEPLCTDTIGNHVTDGPGQAANVLIFAREQQLKETASLAALDDTALYEVCEYRASVPTADPVTMTGTEARARLQAAREEAGPEPLRSYGAPRFTLEHSGAHWWATTHAYTAAGHRDQWNRRHIAVRPLIVARAAHVLMEATGDGCISPVEKPSVRAFGPWVQPVEGAARMVTVYWVTCGTPMRPGAERYAEVVSAYRGAMEAAGWTFQDATEDGGMVFQEPEHTA